MKEKVLFDLRRITPDQVEDELCVLMDGGYTPQLECILAKFIGKIVEITFQEKKEWRKG